VLSRREAKKRAILKLLERIPLKKGSEQVSRQRPPQAAFPDPRPASPLPGKLV
jgi:hypothetical protein